MNQYLAITLLLITACSPKSVWPEEDQNAFNEICTQAVYGLYSREDGKAYCSCVLEQIMDQYPNPETSKDIPFDIISDYADACIQDLDLKTIE